jgi:hypothetical protein
MNKRISALLAVLVAGMPAGVCSADAELPVPVQTYESVRYYSAGTGIEERQQVPQLYPLRVIFSTDKGNLLCDADVTISAKGTTVFRGRAQNGPWLFVDLAPGTYDVQAVQDGKTRVAKGVPIRAGKHRTVIMKWKTTDVDMGL